MQIVCPQCRTTYDVTPAALGSEGRQVRCVRCKTVWLAELAKRAANILALSAPLPGVAGTEPEARPADPAANPAPADVGTAGPEPATAEATPAPAAPPAAPEARAATTPPPASPAAADPVSPAPAVSPAAAAPADAPPPDLAAATPHAPAAEPATPVDIETVAARRIADGRTVKRPARRKGRVRALVAAAVTLAFINGVLIVSRADIVRILPQTASLFAIIGLPVNLRDLAFKDIKTTQELHDGVQILVIEGTIVATGQAVADVPRLRFAIGAANGHEIYAWTALPSRTKLAPGEALAFRTRLASPPEQGRTVQVRFFTRLDLAAGLR